MQLRHFIALTGFFVASVSSGAFAAVVDFDGINVNMGTVEVGQSGTITNNVSESFFSPYYFDTTNDFGFLPSNSVITFSYTFASGSLVGGTVKSYGSYDYNVSGVNYHGNSAADANAPTVSSGYTNGSATTPLVLATANITPTGGKTTIINNSGGLAQFQSIFAGLLNATGGITSITYNVSAVPLPAALPMFGSLIAALFGLNYARNRRNRTALQY